MFQDVFISVANVPSNTFKIQRVYDVNLFRVFKYFYITSDYAYGLDCLTVLQIHKQNYNSKNYNLEQL